MADIPLISNPISDVIREVGQTVRQLIPDPAKAAELQLQLATLADQADAREAQLLQGQVATNTAEASNPNFFVSGWRPYIGWVGGTALAYTWIVAPFLKVFGHLSEMPALASDAIYPIITAMLGIAGMRTWEKVKGVAGG